MVRLPDEQLQLQIDGAATAIVSRNRTLTHRELWDHASSIAETRIKHGSLSPGQYDAFVASNSLSDFWFLLGPLLSGAVPCPLSSRWSALQIEAAKLRLAAANRDHDCAYASAARQNGNEIVFSAQQPVAVVHTSGSSGVPKAAVLSAQSMISGATLSSQCLRFDRGDKWLLSLPLYHVGGLSILYRCMVRGAAMILPDENESLLDAIRNHAPTHVSLVATQLYRFMEDEKAVAALAGCKAVVMGGGPTPTSLIREARARGISLATSYGLTETAAMICSTRPNDDVDYLLSSGKPLADGTVSIARDEEILVRGDRLFLGYLQTDGSLQRSLTEDGWFRTGDLGRFDKHGYLHIIGRRDCMFISGGENIHPEEIETALRNLDGVEDAIVIGVEDREWGRRPVAYVRMSEGHVLNSAAFETSLRTALPGYKIPRTIHPWPMDLAQPGLKPARKDFEKRARDLAKD